MYWLENVEAEKEKLRDQLMVAGRYLSIVDHANFRGWLRQWAGRTTEVFDGRP
jgi:hypothetical protein